MGILSFIKFTVTMVGFGSGIALGLLAGYFLFIYFEPDDVKEPKLRQLNKYNSDALQRILYDTPLWVKSPDWEKVDWLNKFVQEIWPYLNKAICKIIREVAEPYIAEYKPKFHLEAVDFESLTLGTLPPVFMGVKIHETREKELIFEVAAKYAGNPNVKVAVKAYGLKAVAQVVDTQAFATARITLNPLVPVFPCFQRIRVSLMDKPHVDFGLKVMNTDLMAVPGLYRYVQDMIEQAIAKLYLWPNKIEVPVLSTNINFSKQAHGVLAVTVLRARQLRRKDVLGKSDPYVKLKVANSPSQKTKVIRNNLNPEWNQTFSLIVDNPDTDKLGIAVYDWDQVGSHDILGVQSVALDQLNPDVSETLTLKLLKNCEAEDPGNAKNRGELTLEMKYMPFNANDELEDMDVLDSNDLRQMTPDNLGTADDTASGPYNPQTPQAGVTAPGGGLLVVIVHKAEDLEGKHHTNPYVNVIFRGEKKSSRVMKKTRDPQWEADFEYLLDDSPHKDRLLLSIKSKGSRHFLTSKESLGRVEIDLSDVVKNRRINEQYRLIDSKSGIVQVELQWRSTGAISLPKSGLQSPGALLRGKHGPPESISQG